jgi:hypothetical protein
MLRKTLTLFNKRKEVSQIEIFLGNAVIKRKTFRLKDRNDFTIKTYKSSHAKNLKTFFQKRKKEKCS